MKEPPSSEAESRPSSSSRMREQMEKDKSKPRGIPAGYETVLNSMHTIPLDYEFLNEDLTRHLPSIDTDVSALHPLKLGQRATEYADEKRIDDFFRDVDGKRKNVFRLAPERQTVVRDIRKMKSVIEETKRAMDKSGKKLFFVGCDEEKDVSTIQTSIRIVNYDGKGNDFESNVLYQVKAKAKGRRHIFQGDSRKELIEFLTDDRVILVGKAIRDDIKKICEVLGIPNDVRDKIKFIELDQMYNFVYNLLWHPTDARRFLEANHGHDRFVKQYWKRQP